MAKKETKKVTGKKNGKEIDSRKRAKRTTLWLMVLSVVMVAILKTGFIFFILAMLPSIVASFIDRSHNRATFHTILSCNLSGTMPFLGQIIRNKAAQAEIQEVMTDPVNWLIIYAAAGFGWLLVFAAPAFAQGFINMLHQGQITRLDRMQRKIVSEWGPEVEKTSIIQDDDSIAR